MIGRRAAPGPRLSTGRIRVDAARAIAKLRDYQLVDRRTWVLEGIRAAIASGARKVAVRGDANDVWLAWDGEPWPDPVLPALFDELVSPEPARASQHLRLLGTAINSGLGLAPAHVDVTAVPADAAASASRVRYTPEVLMPVEDGAAADDTPLRRLEIVAIDRPEHAPATGMLVHLRRRVGLDVMTNLVRGEPPELAIARAAVADSAIPIQIAGVVTGRDHHLRDLIRLPLGDGLDGFVAVVDPAWPRSDATEHDAILEVAEHGVVLARYSIELDDHHEPPRGPVPLRVYIDAPRMPTNASRSEVRRDAHPIAAAEQRARALLPALIEQLVTELAAGDRAGPRYLALRRAALALLASRIAGHDWPAVASELEPPHRKLADLPLIANAVGTPRAVTAVWSTGIAHVGTPYPVELGRWLYNVVWLDDDAAARVLFGPATIDHREVRRRARRARKALRAMTRFMSHRPRKPKVEPRSRPWVRIELGANMPGTLAPDLFAGLSGEACILPGAGTSELVLLHEGRELETLDVTHVIRFQAVIDSPQLRPNESYRAAVRNETFSRIEWAARAAVVRCAEALAAVRAGDRVPGCHVDITGVIDPAAEAAMLRRAFTVARELGRTIAPTSPLVRAPIWPTVDGRWLRLDEVDAHQTIGTVVPGAKFRLPHNRPVLALDAADRAFLADRLGATADVVHYEDGGPEALDPAMTHASLLARLNSAPALAIREPGLAAAIGLTLVSGKIHFHHVGVALERAAYPHELIPCDIIVDDDALIPDADWREASGPTRDRSCGAWERWLLRSIARAILGDPEPDLVRPARSALSIDDRAGQALIAAIAAHPSPADLLGADLVARLRRFRIVAQLGRDQPVTLDELAAQPGPAIPYITDRPGTPVDGWHPVIADATRATAFGVLIGRSVYEASGVLATRVRAAQRAQRLASHRAWPPVALTLSPLMPQIDLAGEFARGTVGVAELERLVLHVHVEGRKLVTEELEDDLPLLAMVDVADRLIDDDFRTLLPHVKTAIAAEVRARAPALIEAVLARDPRSLIENVRLAALLRRMLFAGMVSDALRATLAGAKMFRLIGGGHGSIAGARDDRKVRTAGWDQDWLAAADGEHPHGFDRPMIHVPDGEDGADRRAIVGALARDGVVDLTDAVARLQTRRRVKRGLLAPPTVPGAVKILTRSLDQLGAVADRLGPGEIALVDDTGSHVLPYARGKAGPSISVDVSPSVRIAVEASDLMDGRLSAEALAGRWGHLQRIATDLVRAVTRGPDIDALPVWARHKLRHAVLTRAIDPPDVGDAPIVPTTKGEWKPWSALVEQRRRFGNVWFTSALSHAVPLDPDRLAFRLGTNDGWRVPMLDLIDATEELRLDEIARINQQRPRASALALTPSEQRGALGIGVEINEAGRRGWVVPLAPGAEALRGVRAHKDMFWFERAGDPCAWPTITVIEDPALAPDRTWSRPAADAAWAALAAVIRSACNRALRGTGAPADTVIGRRFVEASGAPGEIQRTGWLWLCGPSEHPTWLHGPGSVRVAFTDRTEVVAPSAGRPLHGWIAIAAPYSAAQLASLTALFDDSYKRMLREAATDTSRDEVAAHVALGLVVGAIDEHDAPKARFGCFVPGTVGAGALLHLLADESLPVAVCMSDDRPRALAIVDDGSALSRLLLARFDARIKRGVPPRRRTDPPPSPVEPPPRRTPIPAEPPHPMQGLADAVLIRFAAIGALTGQVSRAVIKRGRTGPLVHLADGVIELADTPRLAALEAGRLARSAWASAAIDALVAHAVTVLNAQLTSVTDATEARAIAELLHTAE